MGGAIYSHGSDDRSLFVNLYIPSVLTWKEKGLKVRLETVYPENGRVTLKVVEGERQPLALNLRYPVWAGEGIVVKVNGTKQKITSKPGSFVTLERKWKAGDRIELNIPMNLYTKEMPDNADRRAVFYGPTLLAGALGEKEIEPIRGVPVFVSPDKQVCKYIHPVNGKPLTFETEGLGYPKEVTLIPFYNTYDQYYTVYWDVFSPGEWKQKQAEYEAERLRIEELNKVTVDYIVLGEMQPERDHNLSAGESRIGDFRGKKYRYAYPTGYFDFDMKVSGTESMKMMMTFWGGDCGRDTFEILIDGERLELFSPKGEDGNFVENTIVIPAKFTEGKDKIRVSFKGYEGKRVTSLYIAGMKSIHIFIGIDSHQHFMLRDMTRQRQLYDITVCVGILIQLIDDSQQLFFGNIGRIPHFGALETDLLASLYFAGHISFTRRIVTYQNGHQMRCFGSGCFHPFYFICQLLFYLSCNFFPIY